jgi:hypothetical protein
MPSISPIPNLRTRAFILIILVASALLLPFGYRLDLGPGPDGIRAVLWEYLDAPWFSGIRFVRIGQMLEAILYTFPTYIYIYQVYKLYNGQINRKRMVAVGIFSAIFPGIISLLRMLGWVQGWTQPPPPLSDPYFPIYIPIPSIILISLILIMLAPLDKLRAN